MVEAGLYKVVSFSPAAGIHLHKEELKMNIRPTGLPEVLWRGHQYVLPHVINNDWPTIMIDCNDVILIHWSRYWYCIFVSVSSCDSDID